jgi:hypothetical protein
MYIIVTYRPIARQWLDKRLTALTDSGQTARCKVKPTTIGNKSRRSLLSNGRVFREVWPEAVSSSSVGVRRGSGVVNCGQKARVTSRKKITVCQIVICELL